MIELTGCLLQGFGDPSGSDVEESSALAWVFGVDVFTLVAVQREGRFQ